MSSRESWSLPTSLFLSLMVDETTNVSNKVQLTLVIQRVDDDFAVFEEFVGFIPLLLLMLTVLSKPSRTLCYDFRYLQQSFVVSVMMAVTRWLEQRVGWQSKFKSWSWKLFLLIAMGMLLIWAWMTQWRSPQSWGIVLIHAMNWSNQINIPPNVKLCFASRRIVYCACVRQGGLCERSPWQEPIQNTKNSCFFGKQH